MKPDISLDLYKIFCRVVEAGNMSSAAKDLFISQPAVSMAIRQLEEKMGSPLLVRSSKGVMTTQEGQVLYVHLAQAMGMIQRAEEKYMELLTLTAGELTIGASDTVIANYLLPFLEEYHRLYPDIILRVTNKTTYESLRLLKNGSVDLCFVNLPIEQEEDLEVTPCLDIQDCLVGGEKYKDLARTGLGIQELKEYPLLLLEELSNSRQVQNQYAQANGVMLSPIIELGSSDLLIEFARINLGLTFVIESFTKKQLDHKMLYKIPLYPPMEPRSIGMIHLRTVSMSHAARAFVKLMGLFKND